MATRTLVRLMVLTASAMLALILAGGCLPLAPGQQNPPPPQDTGADMAMPQPSMPPAPPPMPPSVPQPSPQPQPMPSALQAFQSSFYAFATATCAGCHSEKPTAGVLTPQNPLFAASNVQFAYQAAKPFVDFQAPANSLVVKYAGNSHCGIPTLCGSSSAGALSGVTTWIASDTPLPPVTPRAPVSDLAALQLISADLQAQPAATQQYLRYFTLESWGNTGTQPPLVSVYTARSALIKMINLLSTGRNIVQPAAIDSAGLIYRVDMRTLGWTAAAWTNLKHTDPYLAAADFPATLSTAANQTMRADWFITSIPNSPVNAYFEFLGINSDDPTIDAKNNVNRFSDMEKGYPATVRSGFSLSRTEANNRIISWHQTTTFGSGPIGSGHLFKSYNMDGNTGTANVFSHPYRPTTNAPASADGGVATPGPYDFDFADSDNLFTLPNGLFGYYTTEGGTGQVESVANVAAFPGPTFCFQCHDNNTNLIPFVDQVNAAIANAPAGTFPAAIKTLLMGMYNQQALNAEMTSAGAIFAQAYKQLNLPSLDIVGLGTGLGTECMNIVTNNYSIILQADTAAAELGVTTTQMIAAIKGSKTLVTELAALITTDANGNPTGVVRRDLWTTSYAAVRKLLFPQL